MYNLSRINLSCENKNVTICLYIPFAFLVLLTSTAAAVEERPFDINTSAKIVVFGDAHGAFEELTSLLKETGMIDNSLNWAGGRSHLVSMGDLIDRGPRSRDVCRTND
jgi:hypothetical protein